MSVVVKLNIVMLRALIVLSVVALAVAVPPVSKSRAQIQNFAQFLENSQKGTAIDDLAAFRDPEQGGFFQGDIILHEFQKDAILRQYAQGRNAVIIPSYLWPGNELVYDIDESFFNAEQIAAIEAGVADLAAVSCISFRRRTAADTNYVHVTGLVGGCYAHVGYFESRGVHILNLTPAAVGVGCFRHGTIVHEFLHSLAFMHMQSTWNRDEYVRIVWDKLVAGTEHNFYIYDADTVSNLGEEYDYGSCLHYSTVSFSIDGSQTIVPLKEYDGVIGQRIGLSEPDIIKLNRLHSCPGY